MFYADLDNTLRDLSNNFKGKELQKGDDIMTSRILTMAQLEENERIAKENKRIV